MDDVFNSRSLVYSGYKVLDAFERGERMVLLVLDGLIFLSKLQAAARIQAIEVRAVSVSDAWSRARETSPRGLVIDLNDRSGASVDLIRQLKADGATAGIPVVGFLSHVQADLAASARAAGCDMLLARSAFVKQLPELLAKLDKAENGTTIPAD